METSSAPLFLWTGARVRNTFAPSLAKRIAIGDPSVALPPRVCRPPMQLSKGSLLGSYRIEEHIASGGMGEVYKARHTQLERWVAIKVIREGIADDPATLERFHREAKSASRLEHPNICRVYNFGQDGQRSYLVLEFLEGETLAATMANRKLSLAEVLKVGAEIAEALDHAHTHGLVHRDLKPSNVMLTKSGAKVLDFGVAKRASGHGYGSHR